LNSKEALGKIRAILIEGFIKNSNTEDIQNIYYLKNDYLKNIEDFKTILPKDFLKEYKIQIENQYIEFTMETLNGVIYDKRYNINADVWFDTTTKSINALYEIEKMIFKKINNLIENKVDGMLLKIYSLNAFLIFSIISIVALMTIISKKILNSTNRLEQSYEESLQLLEQYKQTVDMSFIVSKTDSKGFITYVNPEFCKISGFKEEELIGKPHNIVRHPDTPKKVFKQMWHTIKELKKPWIGKIKNQTKKKGEYWVQSIINPILDIQGNIIEYIAIRADITELETTKAYFQKQFDITKEDFKDVLTLSTLYENAIEQSNLILRIDPNRKITYANKLFYEKSGYSAKELIGQDYSFIKRPKEITQEDVEKIWSEITKGEIWKGQIANIDKNGKTFHSLATVVPIKNSKGEILEYMSIRKDITDVFSLHLKLEKVQREIIYKMGEIAETRSKETGNHVKRVAYYSRLLAQLYGLPLKKIKILFAASPMHDIGKVGISDSILNKPDKLTKEEFEVMKNHTLLGYNILKESEGEIFQAAAIIAKEHHEKYDGTGYPFGLKANEIHIYGRITAIADVFDALGHERIYKKAWELEKILDLFQKEKGKHFDPCLIELFLENLDKFLEIKESLEE
jgi:PAS domain S-box-containing protein